MSSERSTDFPSYLTPALVPFRCAYGCRRTGPLCRVQSIRCGASPVPSLPCSAITITDDRASVVIEGDIIEVLDVGDLTVKQIKKRACAQHWESSGGKAIFEAREEKKYAAALGIVTEYLKQCTPWKSDGTEDGYFRGIMSGFDAETDSFSPGNRARFCEWDNWKKMRWPTKDEYWGLRLVFPGAVFGVPFSWHGLHGN